VSSSRHLHGQNHGGGVSQNVSLTGGVLSRRQFFIALAASAAAAGMGLPIGVAVAGTHSPGRLVLSCGYHRGDIDELFGMEPEHDWEPSTRLTEREQTMARLIEQRVEYLLLPPWQRDGMA